MNNRAKRAQENKMNAYRKRIVLGVFGVVVVFALILVNGMRFSGYKSSEVRFDSGTLLTSQFGYIQENEVFTPTGEVEPYIIMNGVEEAVGKFMLKFSAFPTEDIPIEVIALDAQGNALTETVSATWGKGSIFASVDIPDGAYAQYKVKIPSTFILEETIYGITDNDRGKIVWFVLAIIFAAVVAYLAGRSKKFCEFIQGVEKRYLDFKKYCKKNEKKLMHTGIIFLATFLLSGMLLYIGKMVKICNGNAKEYVVCFVVLLFLDMFIFWHSYFARRIELIGCISIMLVGTLLSFLEPTFLGVSWDDETHYMEASALSHYIDQNMSMADIRVRSLQVTVALDKTCYEREEQKREVAYMDALDREGYHTKRETKLTYERVAYIPAVIGLLLGRGLLLPWHITFILGRWMNVWVLAILSYFAMKRLKTGKLVVLLIALLPTNIFIASNYSYDTWLTAWATLGLSAFFGEWQQPDKKMSRGTQWLIVLSMFLAVLPKRIYFILTFIVFFIPKSKFNSKKECYIYRLMVLGAVLLPFVTVYLEKFGKADSMGVGDIRGGEGVNATAQVQYMKENPEKATVVLYNFLKDYLNPFKTADTYTNVMAYMGSANAKDYLIYPMLVGAFFSHEEKEPAKFPWWFRLGTLVVYIGTGTLAAVAMYISFTAVGEETVAGCQGRYLIPALFPLYYIWSRNSVKPRVKNLIREENLNGILILTLAAASIWGLWTGCIALY